MKEDNTKKLVILTAFIAAAAYSQVFFYSINTLFLLDSALIVSLYIAPFSPRIGFIKIISSIFLYLLFVFTITALIGEGNEFILDIFNTIVIPSLTIYSIAILIIAGRKVKDQHQYLYRLAYPTLGLFILIFCAAYFTKTDIFTFPFHFFY